MNYLCKSKWESALNYQILHNLKILVAKWWLPEQVWKLHRAYNIWNTLVQDAKISKQDFEFFIDLLSNKEFKSIITKTCWVNCSKLGSDDDYIRNYLINAYLDSLIEESKRELIATLQNFSYWWESYNINWDVVIMTKDIWWIISTKLKMPFTLQWLKQELFLVKDELLNDIIIDKQWNVLFKGVSISVIWDKYIRVDWRLYDCNWNLLLDWQFYNWHLLLWNRYYFLSINNNEKYYVDENWKDLLKWLKFDTIKWSYHYKWKDYFYWLSVDKCFVIVDNQWEVIFQDNDVKINFNTVCKLPLLQSIKKSNGECLFLNEHKILDFTLYLWEDSKVWYFYQQSNEELVPYIIYKSSRFRWNRVVDLDWNVLFQNYINSNPNINYFKVNSMIHLTNIGYLFDVTIDNNWNKFHVILDSQWNRLFPVCGKLIEVLWVYKSIDWNIYLHGTVQNPNDSKNNQSNEIMKLDWKLVNRFELDIASYFDFVPISI